MKTSWISGSLAMAAKQCEMIGWPATSKSGYILSTVRFMFVPFALHWLCIPWEDREKEGGSGFLLKVRRPAHFSRVFFCIRRMLHIFHTRMTAFVTGAPPLAPRTGTCRLAMFVCWSCPALIDVPCGIRGFDGTVQFGAWSGYFEVSIIRRTAIL